MSAQLCTTQVQFAWRQLWAATCSGAHAPGGQAVRRGEAVEHADVLRRQELHEGGVFKHLPLAVQDGGRLLRDVNYFPRDERDGYGENILRTKRFNKKNRRKRVGWLSVAFITEVYPLGLRVLSRQTEADWFNQITSNLSFSERFLRNKNHITTQLLTPHPRCDGTGTYIVFKGVFRGDAVDFLDGVG